MDMTQRDNDVILRVARLRFLVNCPGVRILLASSIPAFVIVPMTLTIKERLAIFRDRLAAA
jgi:hypothetical protein